MGDMSATPHTVDPYLRTARLCGVLAALIGISGILGWIFRIPLLNSIIPGLKPIAISASISFIILGSVQYLAAAPPCHRRRQLVLMGMVSFIALFGLLEIIKLIIRVDVSIEDAILRHNPVLYNNPQVHIAPIAMVLVFLIAIGQALYLAQCVIRKPRRMISLLVGSIGTLVVLGGLASLMGYLYGTPFLLGREFLPIAALAALAALLSGIGLVTQAGDAVFPLNQFAGPSTQARLFRAFLPLTVGLMLLLSIAQFFLTRLTPFSPVIITALLITIFVVIIGVVIRQISRVIGSLIDQAETERRRAQEELQQLNATLEERVQTRTAELEASNKELEDFAYTVAHDLRSPLRSVAGFSEYMLDHYTDRLDARGQDYLHRMRAAAQRMGQLIDDLLSLARFSRVALTHEPVDLSELAARIVAELRAREPERQVAVDIDPGMVARGDRELLKVAIANLIDNAWKFTRACPDPHITIGEDIRQGEVVYYVRDNGVGFDMAHAHNLFNPFHRLHVDKEYPGTGIGLAIVQRIIQRHRGRVWADSAEGKGATLYFTLGKEQG